MAMPPRFKPSCPPDAHKVMRDPENSIRAALAVKISDAELQNGADNICQLLSAFSKTPLTLCSESLKGCRDHRRVCAAAA